MKITKGTIIRTAVFALALINQLLAAFGKSPLPFDSDLLTQLISVAWTVVAGAVAWWKNNSFTKKAIQADHYLKSE